MRKFNIFNDNQVEDIIKLYTEDKLGCHRIGNKYNVSCNVIARLLAKHGITLRSNSEGHKMRSEHGDRYINVDFFRSIDSEEKAYWLGFIVADGSIHSCDVYKSLTISLQEQDKEHIQKIRDVFNGGMGHYNGQWRFYIHNTSVFNNLVNLGIYPDKTHKDEYFETFDKLDDELKRHYLRGIFDGDGTVSFDNRRNTLTCGFIATDKHLHQIISYLENRLNVSHIKIKKYDYYSTINYQSKKDVLKILSYLYDNSTIYLERKFKKFNDNRVLLVYKSEHKKEQKL